MSLSLQPIYLLADSQLLFWRNKDTLFLDSIKKLIACAVPKAAYVGASNSDDPAFYSIFEAAMEGVGIQDCKMILSSFPEEDELFINDSDIILLAGGDVEKGWDVFSKVGLRELISGVSIRVRSGVIATDVAERPHEATAGLCAALSAVWACPCPPSWAWGSPRARGRGPDRSLLPAE
jgi:hypothetical protein